MSRFASIHTEDLDPNLVDQNYSAGFSYSTKTYTHISKPGLSEGVVREISHIKEEPEWMLEKRLLALKQFDARPVPQWGGDLNEIIYDKIHYYLRATDKQATNWSDVPQDVQDTFEKLGVPKAEREVLAGVKMQYDSEVVYGSLKNVWEKEGVIFLSMDEALKQYPNLIKEYFGTLIPSNDNKFSALNTAVWSGGSFVYVPKGVDVKMPLQAYFRINAANAGQFERTLIIVDEGANVHYVEGCFVAGTSIETVAGMANIQDIEKGEFVRTHNGTYKEVYHTQVRPYSGNLYKIEIVGNPKNPIETTEEHPFLVVKRQRGNERNRLWNPEWIKTCDIKALDYLCVPIDKSLVVQDSLEYWVSVWQGKKNGFELEKTIKPSTYHIDGNYLYVPIRRITKRKVDNLPVYNFSVREDESYVAGGVAVHNCTAPSFSSSSLHSAVVEIFVKKGARCQYTTVQNWYKNIYNLVTKRAHVAEEATMIWTDFNMGSKLTMKYPGFILAGKGAKGETLSMAMAGQGQHQDTGSKAIHLAPYTSSTIVSKSISKNGGRTSYRGLVQVGPQSHHSKNTVICDALILDSLSRSDTYPIDRILNNQVEIQHEATVSRIGDEQLFYLMSRGISEEDARKMIVNGFVDDLIRKLPLEYAVEMNRLIDHEMEGSVG